MTKKIIFALALTFALSHSANALSLATAFPDNLSLGASGSDVSKLQTWLVENDFNIPSIKAGGAKGYFGAQTLAAVKAFQTKYAIPATGFVGPLTRAELNKRYYMVNEKTSCRAVFSHCSCSYGCVEVDPSEPRVDCARACGEPTGSSPYMPTCGYNAEYKCVDVSKESAPRIDLMKPAGGETWTMGSNQTLSWTISGKVPAGYSLVIYTSDNGHLYSTSTVASGLISLNVPNVIFYGDAGAELKPGVYKIRAQIYDGPYCHGLCAPDRVWGKPIATDESGDITIKK